MSDTSGHKKMQRDRSPGFPFIPLQTAIDRLLALEAMFGRHPAPANKVGLAWKMKPDSSQAGQTLAALKSFGLVDYKGASVDRVAVITDDGRTYLRAQQDSVKRDILKRIALKPKEIEKYWQTWGVDRPPTPVCLDQLVLRGGYTQGAGDTFLRVYDATVSYAGLGNSDKLQEEEEEIEVEDPNLPEINVGDLIQAEIGGTLVFPSPVRVRSVQIHEGKPWFYVDGSETAISSEQARFERKGASSFTPPPMPFSGSRPEVKVGWKEERLIDDLGDETFITYKGEPSVERYEFIRDYLEFRINRLKK